MNTLELVLYVDSQASSFFFFFPTELEFLEKESENLPFGEVAQVIVTLKLEKLWGRGRLVGLLSTHLWVKWPLTASLAHTVILSATFVGKQCDFHFIETEAGSDLVQGYLFSWEGQTSSANFQCPELSTMPTALSPRLWWLPCMAIIIFVIRVPLCAVWFRSKPFHNFKRDFFCHVWY